MRHLTEVERYWLLEVLLGEELPQSVREHGVEVVDLADPECIEMLGDWIAAHPDVWNEDIGED